MNMQGTRGTQQTAPGKPADDVVDLWPIVSALWRGKLIILGVALLTLILGGLYAYMLATPKYQATSVVMMESRESQVVGLDSVLGGLSGDTSVVNTEVEVLRGRTLMGRVVDELKLIDDPEFNPFLQPPGLFDRLRNLVTGGGDAVTDPQIARDMTVSALLDSLLVRNVPQSLVFQINVTTESPRKSAAIADAISRLYIDDQIRVKFEATAQAAEWLTGQVAELKTELEKSEEQVRQFQTETSLISPESLAALDRQIKDTRERRAAAEAQVRNIAAQGERLKSASSRSEQAAILADPQLFQLAVEADGGNAAAAADFQSRVALLSRQLAQDTQRLQLQTASLATAEQTLGTDISRQSQELIRLEQMMREAESSKLLYEHFQTRLKEATAQQGIQQADSRILSQSVMPTTPSAPRRGVIMALATILGVLLGAGLVLLLEMRAKGIRTARELEEISGRTVLGQIPQFPDKARNKTLVYLSQNPTSAAAEAVRNLRTSILLSDIDRAPQVIAMTSSVPGEGKTTVTLSLAQNLTMMGKRVLVVEGDIRRRVFAQYFNVPYDRGLVAVLSGEVALADAVHPVEGMGDVLIGEKTATNAADLFSSEAFARFLIDVRAHYDVVLIDTPPVLVVPDARVIAQHVDTTVFVVHWDRTSAVQV
ncbi:MAG: Wzz/FepE/Etk N-terminal domain-containing protein, partial [Paracoccaceae bacterium]